MKITKPRKNNFSQTSKNQVNFNPNLLEMKNKHKSPFNEKKNIEMNDSEKFHNSKEKEFTKQELIAKFGFLPLKSNEISILESLSIKNTENKTKDQLFNSIINKLDENVEKIEKKRLGNVLEKMKESKAGLLSDRIENTLNIDFSFDDYDKPKIKNLDNKVKNQNEKLEKIKYLYHKERNNKNITRVKFNIR